MKRPKTGGGLTQGFGDQFNMDPENYPGVRPFQITGFPLFPDPDPGFYTPDPALTPRAQRQAYREQTFGGTKAERRRAIRKERNI